MTRAALLALVLLAGCASGDEPPPPWLVALGALVGVAPSQPPSWAAPENRQIAKGVMTSEQVQKTLREVASDAARLQRLHAQADNAQVERDALCSIGLGTCPVEFRCTAELQRWVGFYRGHLDAATADAVFLASRIWPGNDATCSDQPSSTITRKDVEAMLRAKAGAP